MNSKNSPSSGFWKRKLTYTALRLAGRISWLAPVVNRFLINSIVGRARFRPHPHSTVSDYTSWRSLTDKSWSGRHLEADRRPDYPPVDDLLALFTRRGDEQRYCEKSTLLFPAFAQYLTDGFIRTQTDKDVPDRKKRNTSNHNIDLCPLYGRTYEQTLALREKSQEKGRRGRLKSQLINGEEYARFLYKDGELSDEEFKELDEPQGRDRLQSGARAHHMETLFAFGGDRANSAPQVAMMNTLFLREHNRLAAMLEENNAHWDDDRVFETARNIVIVLFIKVVVQDYIRHIAPIPFPITADPSVAWKAPWNRPNWITTEFSLLYRWHSLIPRYVTWAGEEMPVHKTFLNNEVLLKTGLREAFTGVSAQRAGALGPFNTPVSLLDVERDSIIQGRETALASYADYCRYISLDRPKSFADISSDPEVIKILKKHYKDPDEVEFFVGLFAGKPVTDSPLPLLVLRMVALDAFSQAMNNPLLSEHVFNERTFSKAGMEVIKETSNLRQIVMRNTPGADDGGFIAMTQPDWKWSV